MNIIVNTTVTHNAAELISGVKGATGKAIHTNRKKGERCERCNGYCESHYVISLPNGKN